jgi:hypothetical protein
MGQPAATQQVIMAASKKIQFKVVNEYENCYY